MRARWICAQLLLCVAASQTHGVDDPPPGETDYQNFMTHYYLEKDTEALPAFLKWNQESQILELRPGLILPTSGFLAVIFEDNPELLGRLAKLAYFTGKTKIMVIQALLLSDNDVEIEKIFGKNLKVSTEVGENIRERSMRKPQDIPLMWGAFFASGDVSFVTKVIDVLEPKHEFVGDAKEQDKYRDSAAMSLQRNMLSHELVHRLIQKQAKSRSGVVKKRLEEMLASVQRVKLAKSDGEFTAEIVLVDKAGLNEFRKPVNEIPRWTSLTKARRGDTVAIKIVFAGIALSDDFKADVRYDLKILDPDGKVYEGTDLKDREALHMKVPTRLHIFDNLNVVAIKFEPKDKAGVYQIVSTVRDKIGNKSVSLECKITLEE